jgi:hypothetical protein
VAADAAAHRWLIAALRDRQVLSRLDARTWESVLAEAEAFQLEGRLANDAEAVGVSSAPPIMDRLAGLRALGGDTDRALGWEVGRVLDALTPTGAVAVVLKGAAYVALGLPFARGRRVADLDVLVDVAHVDAAEGALLSHGWIHGELHPYDERYYRLWTHELPPMVHPRRLIPLDLHHGLVPRTSRLRPDAARLIARRLALPSGLSVPCPAHLALHAAIHLFHDGELTGALRDLVDIDGLFRHYGNTPDFWSEFYAEMRTFGVSRPAYYAVRYAARALDTPVPTDVRKMMRRHAPGPTTLAVMDRLVERALLRSRRDDRNVAATVLRARAHLLRMPPGLLARHLTTKTVRRALQFDQRTRTPLV